MAMSNGIGSVLKETKKDPLGDFMMGKDAAQEARMKKINPKGRKLDKNGNPIITKEELTKSGMTLREFMNNERKLTARADSPTKDITDPMQSPAVKSKPTPARAGPAIYETGKASKTDMYKAKMKDIIEEQATKERMDTDPLGMGMKKGGSVRGDGCAIRGKTKGTMR